MIYNSHYWIDAIALEKINNHEIVVLEKDKNGKFTIRHANNEYDWLYNQAAYVNQPDHFDKTIPINIRKGDMCRCLIVNVNMK